MYDITGLLKLLGKPINYTVTLVLILNTSLGMILAFMKRSNIQGEQWITWCISILVLLLSVMLVTMKWFNKLLFIILSPGGDRAKAEETTYHERITPIFADAVQRARSVLPDIKSDVQLYIVANTGTVVKSCGPNIVYVTTGALDAFTDDELGALFARECGHIGNRNFELKTLLFISNIPNVICVVFWFIVDLFIGFFQKVFSSESSSPESGLVGIACFVGRVLFFFAFLPIFLWIAFIILLNMYSLRQKELDADILSVRLGYADALQSVLPKLYEEETAWYKRFISVVPTLQKRMENIQKALNPEDAPDA